MARKAEVVPGASEDGVDGILVNVEKEFLSEVTVGLHVSDHGLDGGASALLAADCGRDAALLARDKDRLSSASTPWPR